jgi:acyl-CoA reductase-like NAD-dependent aldehyde dehydrogenase
MRFLLPQNQGKINEVTAWRGAPDVDHGGLKVLFHILTSHRKEIPRRAQMQENIDTGYRKQEPRKRLEIKSTSPATGKFLGKVEALSHEDVIIAVEKARAAQVHWSKTSFEFRKELLLKLNDVIYDRIDEIASIISQENGKPRTEALSTEVLPSLYAIQYIAKNAERMLRDEPIHMFIWRMAGKRSYIQHKPLGVVGIISPWNYPWGIPVGQIATALIAGNTVVLKPSSSVPLIGEKIREVFAEAGFPEHVFTVVQGPGAVGEAIVEGQVDHLIFTGSVEIGRHVASLASKHLIPITLELGGKDPAIVLDDADLEASAAGVIWGAFANSGQTCASIERVYVLESVYDRFVELIKQKASKLRQGPDENFDVDVGAMTSRSQLEIVKKQVADALEKGATVEVGGKTRDDLPGFFFQPTVLTGVCHSMDVMTEETFGPLLPIQKVKDEAEAIRLANDSRFGLTASVWTTDSERGERVAAQLVTGTVTINDSLWTFGAAETPWGGVKESGIGRTHGKIGLMEMVRPLHISVDSFPRMKKPWWYPYDEKLYLLLKKGMVFLTRKRFGTKSAGLFDTVKNLSLKNKL